MLTQVGLSLPGRAIRVCAERGRATLAWRHPVVPLAVGSQLALMIAASPWYGAYNLRIAWSTWLPILIPHAALLGAWLYYRRYAAHPTKHITLDVILGIALVATLTEIVSPSQYLAVAIKRPLIDSWLARADALIGVDVAALAHWTAAHPSFSTALNACYNTLYAQFVLPILVAGLAFGDRDALWEFVFHFHFCLIATLAALAIFPAECAFLYNHFEPTIDQSRFIAQFTALRDGTFHVISFGSLEGLISMPSFHAAGALMVTWAFRRHRRSLVPVAIVNAGLIAATFMSGAHYVVDVTASVLLFAVSVVVYRTVVARTQSAAAPASIAPAA